MWLKAAGEPEADLQAMLDGLLALRDGIMPFAGQSWRVLEAARADGKRVLFEGAQGVMLDIDHGTYPFVTSSNTVAGQAATGAGTGPTGIGFVLGITKAYSRASAAARSRPRISAPMATGWASAAANSAPSPAQRRCGWFDAVMVRQANAVAGITGMALTKLDVLDGFETLKICTGYEVDGRTLDHFPSDAAAQAACTPVYEEMPGWSESTYGARSWAELPANAVKYIRRVEELTRTPVTLLSTSPERDDTILVTDPFGG